MTTEDKYATIDQIEVAYPTGTMNGVNYQSVGELKAGQTITLTLTSNATDVDTKGTIKIQPETPEEATSFTGSSTSVKAEAGRNGYYSYKVLTPGRYSFGVTAAKDNTLNLAMAQKDDETTGKKVNVQSGDYFDTNDVIYFTVSTSQLKEQTGTLKIEAIANKLDAEKETTITVEQNADVFYIFEAKEHATYSFGTSNMTAVENKNIATEVKVFKYDDKKNTSLDNVDTVVLKKDEKVLVKIHTTNPDTEFKYTVKKTPIHVVQIGKDATAPIKNGETATFEFEVLNAGLYAFQTSGLAEKPRFNKLQSRVLSQVEYSNATEKGYYVVKDYREKSNKIQTFTITNNSGEDANVTVKVSEVDVVALTADVTDATITINKGECAYVKFVPTAANGRYTFVNDNDKVAVENGFEDKLLTRGDKNYELIRLTVNDPENKSTKETAKVKVTTVKTTAIDKTASFDKPAVGATWFEFTAPNDAKYKFELKDGKDAEAVVAGASLEKYSELLGSSDGSLTELWMAKGDKVVIKASASVDKGTSLKLDITETKPEKFYNVKFTETAGKSHTEHFDAAKGETYTVTFVGKGKKSVDTYTLTAAKTGAEEGEAPIGTATVSANGVSSKTITLDSEKEAMGVELIVEKGAANADNSYCYIIVEKNEKPKEENK